MVVHLADHVSVTISQPALISSVLRRVQRLWPRKHLRSLVGVPGRPRIGFLELNLGLAPRVLLLLRSLGLGSCCRGARVLAGPGVLGIFDSRLQSWSAVRHARSLRARLKSRGLPRFALSLLRLVSLHFIISVQMTWRRLCKPSRTGRSPALVSG